AAGVHGVHVAGGRLEVRLRVQVILAATGGLLDDPPGRVGADAVLRLEPVAALSVGLRPGLLHQGDPLVEGAAGLFFPVGDDRAVVLDAGVRTVQRRGGELAGHGSAPFGRRGKCGIGLEQPYTIFSPVRAITVEEWRYRSAATGKPSGRTGQTLARGSIPR